MSRFSIETQSYIKEVPTFYLLKRVIELNFEIKEEVVGLRLVKCANHNLRKIFNMVDLLHVNVARGVSVCESLEEFYVYVLGDGGFDYGARFLRKLGDLEAITVQVSCDIASERVLLDGLENLEREWSRKVERWGKFTDSAIRIFMFVFPLVVAFYVFGLLRVGTRWGSVFLVGSGGLGYFVHWYWREKKRVLKEQLETIRGMVIETNRMFNRRTLLTQLVNEVKEGDLMDAPAWEQRKRKLEDVRHEAGL